MSAEALVRLLASGHPSSGERLARASARWTGEIRQALLEFLRRVTGHKRRAMDLEIPAASPAEVAADAMLQSMAPRSVPS